jgi:hypothetical protein
MSPSYCGPVWIGLLALGLHSTLPVIVVDAELQVPGLLDRMYPISRVREADVNVGLIVSIHQTAASDARCDDLRPGGVIQALAMQFAVDEINERDDLMPNVTLGFVQLDDCWDSLKALEASVYFVKDNCGGGGGYGGNVASHNVSSGDTNSFFQSYEVIGIIGPEDSETSITISPYLGTFRIPHMAVYATANSLSDKARFPYFMRLVPAESGQQQMLLEV